MSKYLITVDRIREYEGSTVGHLKVNGVDMGYSLEDGHNDPKIYGETRIPAGVYDLALRKVGGFHSRYSKASWLPDGMHKGMIELQDVPGFKYILIHTGNTKEHTHGCILCGASYKEMGEDGFFVSSSRTTYKRFYKQVAEAIESGKKCQIRIKDEKDI